MSSPSPEVTVILPAYHEAAVSALFDPFGYNGGVGSVLHSPFSMSRGWN
jgi:hypothetical protein